MLKIMKIRRESYGSLNFHVNKIFKLSVMNLDHMMEVGLQKKKEEETSTYRPSLIFWMEPETNVFFVFFFVFLALVNQNAELCY